MISKEKLKN